ncbi:hypothetical protein Tco_0838338 [Tanacetum coccineum]|uniref:Uncharacterized protein n=1 Tax=Tanacetum coccineum TaxID=301880 RepID=A0ABQ5AMI1_9ASTR
MTGGSKDFITAIEKRLQIRRIYRSLESFVGGRDFKCKVEIAWYKQRCCSLIPTESDSYLLSIFLGLNGEVKVINMPRAIIGDIPLTKSYIPKVSETPSISPTIANLYKPIEDRCIHEGRVVDQIYYTSHHIDHCFSNVRLKCLYEINEPIVRRFILDFYSQVTLQREDSGHILISFMIQNEFITLSLAQFGQILRIPYNGQASSQTNGILHLLHSSKRLRDHIIPIFLLLTKFVDFFNRNEELIRENVFGLGGHQDHLLASLAHMLYCIVAEEQYNLAYFFVKRIEYARATSTVNLPYGMFLTRLFRYVMEHYPHLDNSIYNVVDRIMCPLTLKQTRKPRSDHGMPKSRHSVSSSSTHHYGSLSHHGDDDEDDGITHASTPSRTTFLNSLSPHNYQKYDIPTSSQQDDDLLFERQTALLNQTQKMHEEVRGGFNTFEKSTKRSL